MTKGIVHTRTDTGANTKAHMVRDREHADTLVIEKSYSGDEVYLALDNDYDIKGFTTLSRAALIGAVEKSLGGTFVEDLGALPVAKRIDAVTATVDGVWHSRTSAQTLVRRGLAVLQALDAPTTAQTIANDTGLALADVERVLGHAKVTVAA